jgi:OFA family oxalate/formate antiporter-like MFS transporter
MKKYLTVVASFIIMLCLGSVYAWSIIASELIDKYSFSASQAQIIFGSIIAVFPLTMIFVGQIGRKIKARYIAYFSAFLFFAGNITASCSNGNFIYIFLGIGILTGIATGFGYWVALTTPVRWFPQKKGLITGIAAAGFGLGAVLMSDLSEKILLNEKDVLQLFAIIGSAYGIIIFLVSNLIIEKSVEPNEVEIKITEYLRHKLFKRLFMGIFLGTFAGLLIIGNLKIIGGQGNISEHYLVVGVSLFALANFLGRLVWGFIADYIGANISIFMALLVQSVAIFLLNIIALSDLSYMLLASLIGFGFGGNFVLFAKETAHIFGLSNLGIVYPYVFLGYAIAGIAGPFIGGLLYDISGAYFYAILLSGFMSLLGSILFFYQYIKHKNNANFK